MCLRSAKNSPPRQPKGNPQFPLGGAGGPQAPDALYARPLKARVNRDFWRAAVLACRMPLCTE